MDLLELHAPDRLPLLVEKTSNSELAALRLMRHRLSGSEVVAELLNEIGEDSFSSESALG